MTIDTMVNLISYLNYYSNSTVRNNNAVNYFFQDQDRAINFYSFVDDLIDQLELSGDIEVSLRADFDISSKTFSYTVKLIGE